ncbi:STAS domain-containing protein [Actinophytocola sp. NPDC049390]|uniref:STAS domain-containing protein n=1 Tax=Actinophytocola sp. NPDC049390 TaxID=3363894 RepID=UPI0037960AE8
MSLSVCIEHIGSHLLVHVGGDVDLENAAKLTDTLVAAASAPNNTGMIIDLAATTFFGASGLTALVTVANRGHDDGFPVAVTAPRHSIVRRVITLTSLTDILPFTDTVRDAQVLLDLIQLTNMPTKERSRLHHRDSTG